MKRRGGGIWGKSSSFVLVEEAAAVVAAAAACLPASAALLRDQCTMRSCPIYSFFLSLSPFPSFSSTIRRLTLFFFCLLLWFGSVDKSLVFTQLFLLNSVAEAERGSGSIRTAQWGLRWSSRECPGVMRKRQEESGAVGCSTGVVSDHRSSSRSYRTTTTKS